MKPQDFRLNEQIRIAYKNTARAAMRLYVIMRGGVPLELPTEPGTETDNRLMDIDDGVGATFAIASTNLQHVRAMRKVLPELLDVDDDMQLEIHSLTITPSMWTKLE